MDHFTYRHHELHAENVALKTIAREFGTPSYIYSRATLERHYRVMDEALGGLPHTICYAVKANGNLGVLSLLARLGAGFDIVSVGELERVRRAGGDPGRVVFSGVGKRADEMATALEAGIRCFNVESVPELETLNRVAESQNQVAAVSLRVNPDVDAKTHPYIATGLRENKFGIAIEKAGEVYRRAATMPGIRLEGLACHIGSQLTQLAPFEDAMERLLHLVDDLESAGIVLHHLDVGGGLGIRYRDESPPGPDQYAGALRSKLAGRDLELLLEPGRVLVGNAGILLTRTEYIKRTPHRNFAIVDGAMNDLMRPALYDAWHEILPVNETASEVPEPFDVVGPVCETGDFLGLERTLSIAEGDLLAVRSAGAYGFSMSSNYNARPRAAEIMVDGGQCHLVRERETLDDLMRGEHPLEDRGRERYA